MNICHVMFYDKYINEYITFINKNSKKNYISNKFIVIKTPFLNKCKEQISKYNNVLFLDRRNELNELKKYLDQSDKIILHSLYCDSKLLIYLFINRKYLRKMNWVIWGADLYNYKYRKNSIKSNIKEFIRGKIIRSLSNITSLIKGDYQLAQSVYKTKAKYNYAFYPLPVDFKLLDKSIKEYNNKDKTTIIQVGNSADPTNDHIDILNCLSKFKDENMKIICPLSYGNNEYANKVISYGKQVFKNKFIALTNYLKPEEYSKVLCSVDIAIFNHRRQQALGNIIALLYLGKKVYIRSDITPWSYFKELNVEIFDTINLDNEKYNKLIYIDEGIYKKNRKLIGNEFSEEHCIELWEKVFENTNY